MRDALYANTSNAFHDLTSGVFVNGAQMYYLETIVGRGSSYSPDGGTTWHQLRVGELCKSTVGMTVIYDNPTWGEYSKFIHRIGNNLAIIRDEHFYREGTTEFPTAVILLPVIREARIFGQCVNGDYVYLSNDKYYSPGYKLFVGSGDGLRQVQLNTGPHFSMEPSLTVTFSTDTCPLRADDLISPKRIFWDGKGVTPLNPADYNIVETLEGMVTIECR